MEKPWPFFDDFDKLYVSGMILAIVSTFFYNIHLKKMYQKLVFVSSGNRQNIF